MIDVATSLFGYGRYTFSIFLAYNGVEEYGKALLLMDEIRAGKNSISKSRWKNIYENHKRKIKRVQKALHEKVYRFVEYKATISMYGGKIGEEIPEEQTIKDLTDLHFEDKLRSIYVNIQISPSRALSWKTPQDHLTDSKIRAKMFLNWIEYIKLAVQETKKDLGL